MNGNAASEVLLAGVALSMAWRLDRARPGIAIGVGLIGLAALLGALRYAGLGIARAPHDFASLAAASAGLPLLAASLQWPRTACAARPAGAAAFAVAATALGMVMVGVLPPRWWWQAVPAAAVLLMCAATLKRGNAAQVAAALLLAAAFVSNAAGWTLAPLNGLQQLHVLMSMSLLLLWAGIAFFNPR